MVSMIVMTAMLVIAVAGTALIGIGNLDTSLGVFQSQRALRSAESCVEEATLRLQRDESYAGETLSVGNTTCTIVVTGNPCPCTISVAATDGSYTRRLQASVTLSGGDAGITTFSEQD